MFKGIRRKIILSNLIGLPLFFIGLVMFNYSRDSLIELKLSSMIQHADMISAIITSRPAGHYSEKTETIRAGENGFFLRQPIIPANMRARLFDLRGKIIDDSRNHPPEVIVSHILEPLNDKYEPIKYYMRTVRYYLIDIFYNLRKNNKIIFENNQNESIKKFTEVSYALRGEPKGVIRITNDNMILSVGVPVRNIEKTLGVLQLSLSGNEISELIAQDRNNVIIMFVIASIMSFIISLMLAHNILTPIHELVMAVHMIQGGNFRSRLSSTDSIPNLSMRKDEIGILSRAFLHLIQTIKNRIDEIENFAADVSHELKNPLTSLKNAIETLERINDAEKRKRLLDIIHHDIKRTHRLIGDISGVSRLDGQMQRERLVEIEMPVILLELVNNYKETKISQDIDLTLEYDKAVSYKIEGIYERIAQIFHNLIDNALSFTPKGGEVKIILSKDLDHIHVKITDEGMGIAEESLDKIFDRFYSHRPHDTSFGNHSGLGLSIVKQIITAHNGTITSSNIRHPQTGEITGACFHVTLPSLSYKY